MTTYPLTARDRELIEKAWEVLESSFDVGVYRHTVGAALLSKDGSVYTGINCDGIHGSCAEFIAVGAAVAAGVKEQMFDTIVAVRRKAPNRLVSPCGNCRQMLLEYNPDIKVILNSDEGLPVKVTVRDLLPFAYVFIPN